MDNLEEDLTCSVCYGLFSDPRVLPCSHTFCKTCLENVLKVSVNFSIWRPLRLPLKCPNCRSAVELPTNGVDALPVNVCLRAIVEKYRCDGETRSPACPEHPGQPLNVYCVQDRELICGFCLTVGQHRGHAIDDLHAAYLKERATRAQLLEPLRGERWDEILRLAECLQQEKVRSEGVIQKDREVVTLFFQDLELALGQKREQFMQALDGASALLASTYEPLVERLKHLQEEQSELISLGSVIEQEEQPLVYLENVHQLRERVNALSQTALPQIPRLLHEPQAERFFEEHWADLTLRNLRDGPVPEISCHTHRRSVNGLETHQRWFWQVGRSSALLLLLILVLSVACLNSGFSVSSGLTYMVSVSGELTHPLHDMWTYLTCISQNIIMKLSSYISTVGENIYQHLLTLLSILH